MLKTNKYLNYSDLISYSWNKVTSNIGLFIAIMFFYILLQGLIMGGQYYTEKIMPQYYSEAVVAITGLVLGIITNVLGVVMGIGFIRILFALFDNEKPGISMLFSAYGCFWRYVFATIWYVIILLVGTVLFVFPAVIWGIKFQLYPYFVIDKGLGPMDALEASSKATNCMKWHWFGLISICGLIMFVGLLCFGVGAIISYPVALMVMALGYRQLAAQTPELAEFGVVPPQATPSDGQGYQQETEIAAPRLDFS